MSAHRFICRLDFDTKFAVIDSPGKIMEILLTRAHGLFSSVEESKQHRRVGAKSTKGDENTFAHYAIWIEPAVLALTLEQCQPIRTKVGSGDLLAQLADVVDIFCETYGIKSFRRGGCRFWFLRNSPLSVTDQLGEELLNATSCAGELVDTGIVLKTKSEEGGHTLNFGPFNSEAEHDKFFENLPALNFSLKSNLIYDIDSYEHNFSLKGRQFSKWLRANAANTQTIVSKLDSAMGATQ